MLILRCLLDTYTCNCIYEFGIQGRGLGWRDKNLESCRTRYTDSGARTWIEKVHKSLILKINLLFWDILDLYKGYKDSTEFPNAVHLFPPNSNILYNGGKFIKAKLLHWYITEVMLTEVNWSPDVLFHWFENTNYGVRWKFRNILWIIRISFWLLFLLPL